MSCHMIIWNMHDSPYNTLNDCSKRDICFWDLDLISIPCTHVLLLLTSLFIWLTRFFLNWGWYIFLALSIIGLPDEFKKNTLKSITNCSFKLNKSPIFTKFKQISHENNCTEWPICTLCKWSNSGRKNELHIHIRFRCKLLHVRGCVERQFST